MTSARDPNPDAASTKTVARIRGLAARHPHAAICIDSGRSFRAEVDPTYKANRPEREETLKHQIALAIETLRADGFPIWGVKGFEADDVIATAAVQAVARSLQVVVASADKDLLQLVAEGVTVRNSGTGILYDAPAVAAKFGVQPEQIRDFLMLVGDASDNVRGAKGIGAKKAADLLGAFGSIQGIYAAINAGKAGRAPLTPSVVTSLVEFYPRTETVQELVSLRYDVPLPFEEVLADRVPQDAEAFSLEEPLMEDEEGGDVVDAETSPGPGGKPPEAPPAAEPPAGVTTKGNPIAHSGPTEAGNGHEMALVAPVRYELQLDPRSLREAQALATSMHASRMFSSYGSPAAVLSTIMVGRELGMPAMASLRSIHNIEGRHALSAALMVALVLKSGFAEYFEPVEFDQNKATFLTKRKGARKEVQLTHTIEMAVVAGLVKKDSNWMKVPVDMLVSRAQSRLARMIYPDLLAGMYTPEELREIAEARGE